jgi:[ribosomal protein S18]-alanine N-acetyltransferase
MSLVLRDMQASDLDAVLCIERQVHSHPWTEGNFLDALLAGYVCKLLESAGQPIGYAVLMFGVDEAELLDLSVTHTQQRKGWGKQLLLAMLSLAQENKASRVLLEVRTSNIPAIALYQTTGFSQIGVRRGYYVTKQGREDAMMMEWKC